MANTASASREPRPREAAREAVSPTPKPTLSDRLLGWIVDWRVRRLERSPRAWVFGGRGNRDWPPPAVPAGIIRAVQDIRLRRLLRYVGRRSPFYRARFAEAGVDPTQFRGAADFRRLPLTTPDDLQETDRLLCVPWDEIAHIFTTSGTSGRPKQICLTEGDFDRIVNFSVNLERPRASRTRELVMIAHAQGLFGIVPQAQAINERLGRVVLPIGQPTPTKMLELLDSFRPNVVTTSPSYMAALTREAEHAGFRHRLDRVVMDGELLTASQAKRFGEFWQAEIVNAYGLTEIGGIGVGLPPCDALHLNELQILVEILDPTTHEPAEEGELVATTLTNRAMPLLRYRTGDRCRLVNCSCGWKTPAIYVRGRIGDNLVVAATNIDGPTVAEAVGGLEGVTGSLEMIVDHVEGIDRLTMRVGIEPQQSVDVGAVADRLFQAYPALRNDRQACAFELAIELVENLRLAPKSLRIRDLRGDEPAPNVNSAARRVERVSLEGSKQS